MSYKRKRESLFEYMGENYPVNANEEYLCVEKYLEKMAEQMTRSLVLHSKVVFARFDLTSFDWVENNKPIEELIRRIKIWLKREYKMKNIGHFWVRESDKNKGLHWHCVFMLDGHKVRTNFTLNEFVQRYWTLRDIGNFAYPKRKSYHFVKRGDKVAFDDAFYHASYLAKERSKGHRGLTACQYGASKLKAIGTENNRNRNNHGL